MSTWNVFILYLNIILRHSSYINLSVFFIKKSSLLPFHSSFQNKANYKGWLWQRHLICSKGIRFTITFNKISCDTILIRNWFTLHWIALFGFNKMCRIFHSHIITWKFFFCYIHFLNSTDCRCFVRNLKIIFSYISRHLNYINLRNCKNFLSCKLYQNTGIQYYRLCYFNSSSSFAS